MNDVLGGDRGTGTSTIGRRVAERLCGTAATVAAAVLRGADLVRVHDVREMADVVRMSDSLR